MSKQGPCEATVIAWTRLIRARTAVLAAVEKDLKAQGFPPLGWYDILLELSRAPHGALRPFELEQRVLLAQYNLSRLIDRLSSAGYVEKKTCPADKRGQFLAITETGRQLGQQMWPAYADAIQRHLGSRLQHGEAQVLGDLLGRLIDTSGLEACSCGPAEDTEGTEHSVTRGEPERPLVSTGSA